VCDEELFGIDRILVKQREEPTNRKEKSMGRGILLWLLGVPIPIIILLALFFHH
jgi:hypothetical protein